MSKTNGIDVKMPIVSGNSEIISFELQIDNGKLGNFISVGGFDQISM